MMRKLIVILTLAVMAIVGAVSAPGAHAQGTAPDVSGLTPFSPAANYMSLPGYLRYRTLLQTGHWLSREEAEQQVKTQGAPTGPVGG